MNVRDVELGRQLVGIFSFLNVGLSIRDEGSLIRISADNSEHKVLVTLKDGRSLIATPIDHNARVLVEEVTDAGLKSLCWIVNIQEAENSLIIIQAHIFPSLLTFLADAPLRISVTETILDDLHEKDRHQPLNFMRQNFLLEDMAFMIAGQQQIKDNFRLLSTDWICDIAVDPTGLLQCRRVRRQRRHNLNHPITLLRGAIEFVDDSIAGAKANLVLNRLREAVRDPESYLSTWDFYNQLEEQILTNQAVDRGYLVYNKVKWIEAGDDSEYIFTLSENVPPRFRVEPIHLDAGSEPFLEDPDTDQYIFPDNLVYVGEIIPAADQRNLIRTRIDLEAFSTHPPAQGYLMVSRRGDKVRIRRRNRALSRVQQGKTPLFTLGLLLETDQVPFAQRRHTTPLSDATRRTIGHKPTESQKDALDVAINTPDIAIIQGPPGTGKTTVIRALMTRLAEVSEKHGEQASVLLSSYQHDAVDNVVTGIDIGGLPPYRVGGKRGENKEIRERGLWEWVAKRKELCKKELNSMGERPTKQIVYKVDQLIYQIRTVRGGSTSTASLLKEIIEQAGAYLEIELLTEIELLIARFSTMIPTNIMDNQYDSVKIEQLQMLLRNQRLGMVSFLDDGPLLVKRLISFLTRNGSPLNIQIPTVSFKLAEWHNEENHEPNDLANLLVEYEQELNKISQQIFGILSVPEAYIDDSKTENLDELLSKVAMTVRKQTEVGLDGVATTLNAFIDELDDPEAVRDMITQYAGVVAGTCQQVVSVNLGLKDREYEFVIIDEAARANPLDLLIPMSLGRRIILVGDHIQLPHVLEEEVLANFERNHESQIVEFLKESLFERLFKRFENIHLHGGPKRVVTLLDDFRMHPTISTFISNTFYEGRVVPMCTPETHAHNLGLYANRPICWLDVPISREPETRGRSKSRKVEIDEILTELEQIFRLNNEFSIGIISFYSEQAGQIQSKVDELPYDWKNRVLVGTVDAFQGREFDIVFLSTVRSNLERQDLRKRVGFLASQRDSRNRLCVALSRAKRLLVVVGDTETVVGSVQEPVVPILKDFHDLCCSEEGYYELR